MDRRRLRGVVITDKKYLAELEALFEESDDWNGHRHTATDERRAEIAKILYKAFKVPKEHQIFFTGLQVRFSGQMGTLFGASKRKVIILERRLDVGTEIVMGQQKKHRAVIRGYTYDNSLSVELLDAPLLKQRLRIAYPEEVELTTPLPPRPIISVRERFEQLFLSQLI